MGRIRLHNLPKNWAPSDFDHRLRSASRLFTNPITQTSRKYKHSNFNFFVKNKIVWRNMNSLTLNFTDLLVETGCELFYCVIGKALRYTLLNSIFTIKSRG